MYVQSVDYRSLNASQFLDDSIRFRAKGYFNTDNGVHAVMVLCVLIYGSHGQHRTAQNHDSNSKNVAFYNSLAKHVQTVRRNC